jgi:hypothetical protein
VLKAGYTCSQRLSARAILCVPYQHRYGLKCVLWGLGPRLLFTICLQHSVACHDCVFHVVVATCTFKVSTNCIRRITARVGVGDGTKWLCCQQGCLFDVGGCELLSLALSVIEFTLIWSSAITRFVCTGYFCGWVGVRVLSSRDMVSSCTSLVWSCLVAPEVV